jgi:hypothetical protein
MADQPISGLTALTAAATGDLLEIVDVSDTTMAATGTNKKITAGQLMASPGAIGGTTPAAGSFTTLSASGATITGAGTLGQVLISAAGDAADSKTWGIQIGAGTGLGAGVFNLRAINDAVTSGINAITITRTGVSSIDLISLKAPVAVTGALSATTTLSTSDTTDATSTTAASLKTAGGLAVAKKAYFGDTVNINGKGLVSTTSVTIPISTTKTFTVSCGAPFEFMFGLGGEVNDNSGFCGLKLEVFGSMVVSAAYQVTEVARFTYGSYSISAITKNSNNFTFTVTNSSSTYAGTCKFYTVGTGVVTVTVS